MSSFLNTVIVVSVGSLIIGFLRFVVSLISGGMRPLSPRGQAQDSSQGVHVDRSEIASEPDCVLTGLSDECCPIHNGPYEAVACFALVRPPQHLNVFRQNAAVTAQIQVALCGDCVPTACSTRNSGFIWSRRNYNEHPPWGSANLYPHLLGDRRIRLWSVTRRSGNGSSWEECLQPESGELLTTVPRAVTASPEEIIEEYAPFLKAENVYLPDTMPRAKLREAIRSYAPIGRESVLVFIDKRAGWTGCGLVLTDKQVFVDGFGPGDRKSMALARINGVAKKAAFSPFGSPSGFVRDDIHVNGERLCYFPVWSVTDALVLMLRELSVCCRNASAAGTEMEDGGVTGTVECAKCKRSVFPTSDGDCPGCGLELLAMHAQHDEPTPCPPVGISVAPVGGAGRIGESVPAKAPFETVEPVSIPEPGAEAEDERSGRECPRCGRRLRRIQVQLMVGNPEYQQWCREGFCSLACFEGADSAVRQGAGRGAAPRACCWTTASQSQTAGPMHRLSEEKQ